MEENIIEEFLKNDLEQLISARVDEEIQKKVKDFAYELESRKDNYIAEIMKGIRISHEREQYSNGVNYRIIFENIVRLEK